MKLQSLIFCAAIILFFNSCSNNNLDQISPKPSSKSLPTLPSANQLGVCMGDNWELTQASAGLILDNKVAYSMSLVGGTNSANTTIGNSSIAVVNTGLNTLNFYLDGNTFVTFTLAPGQQTTYWSSAWNWACGNAPILRTFTLAAESDGNTLGGFRGNWGSFRIYLNNISAPNTTQKLAYNYTVRSCVEAQWFLTGPGYVPNLTNGGGQLESEVIHTFIVNPRWPGAVNSPTIKIENLPNPNYPFGGQWDSVIIQEIDGQPVNITLPANGSSYIFPTKNKSVCDGQIIGIPFTLKIKTNGYSSLKLYLNSVSPPNSFAPYYQTLQFSLHRRIVISKSQIFDYYGGTYTTDYKVDNGTWTPFSSNFTVLENYNRVSFRMNVYPLSGGRTVYGSIRIDDPVFLNGFKEWVGGNYDYPYVFETQSIIFSQSTSRVIKFQNTSVPD